MCLSMVPINTPANNLVCFDILFEWWYHARVTTGIDVMKMTDYASLKYGFGYRAGDGWGYGHNYGAGDCHGCGCGDGDGHGEAYGDGLGYAGDYGGLEFADSGDGYGDGYGNDRYGGGLASGDGDGHGVENIKNTIVKGLFQRLRP